MVPVNTSVVSGVALTKIGGTPKLLLLKRTEEQFWCHVAGKIEGQETAYQAIVREFHEETGIRVTELYNAEYAEQFYEASRNRLMIIPAFVVFCRDEQPVTLNVEHTAYRWCTLDEALALAPYPNQKKLYRHVWEYFVDTSPAPEMRIRVAT